MVYLSVAFAQNGDENRGVLVAREICRKFKKEPIGYILYYYMLITKRLRGQRKRAHLHNDIFNDINFGEDNCEEMVFLDTANIKPEDREYQFIKKDIKTSQLAVFNQIPHVDDSKTLESKQYHSLTFFRLLSEESFTAQFSNGEYS